MAKGRAEKKEAETPGAGYLPAQVVNGLLGDRRADAVNFEELLQEVINQFGGYQSFAQQIHADYEQAPPGSVAKQRVSAAIMGMVARQAELKSKREADLEGLSDEDLQKTAEEFLKKRFPPLCVCPGCGLEFVAEEGSASHRSQGAAEPAPGRTGEGSAPAGPGGAVPAQV